MDLIRRFLRGHSTLTLATLNPAGGTAAADLYYVADGALNFYFLSESRSRHAENVATNSQVAATIHAQAWDWQEIKGVQLEGVCQAVMAPAARAAALALYGRKFSSLLSPTGAGKLLITALTRHTVYRISPHWIRWLDNSMTFGYKEEWRRQNGEWVAVRG